MGKLPFAYQESIDNRPAIHALIVGCSRYENLENLDCGAITAAKFFRAICEANKYGRLVAPLATITLLMSPTNVELAEIDKIVPRRRWWRATAHNVALASDRHRKLVGNHELNCKHPTTAAGCGLGIYYFGGHGADVFRTDPIGFASDARKVNGKWRGLINHFEKRHALLNNGIATFNDEKRLARHLFLYDCCSEWIEGLDDHFEPRANIAASPIERRWAAISAADAGFLAWEPADCIAGTENLVGTNQKVSFFGYGLLHGFEHCDEATSVNGFGWQTSARSLAKRIPDAIQELALIEGNGEPIRGAGAQAGHGSDFPIVLSDSVPEIAVSWTADHEVHRKTKKFSINVTYGIKMKAHESGCPWTRHPFFVTLSPGKFCLSLFDASGKELYKGEHLFEMIVTEWGCIVKNDNISVQDPRTGFRD